MSPRLVPAASDPVRRRDRPLGITVDGVPLSGVAGQSLAGVMLAAGRTSWRTGRSGAPGEYSAASVSASTAWSP